jgi:hypothetical protein
MVALSYGVDMNWYTDIEATDHITVELDKLAVKERYYHMVYIPQMGQV